MCGLFGWQLSEKGMQAGDVKLLAAFLGTEMDSRGGDSWGVALPLSGQMYKGLGKFSKGKVINEIVKPIVLGHTRRATTGKVTLENAHPFIIGNTIGAHNGIISNDDELSKKYKRDFSVDSMHLLAHIDEGKDIKEISGYGTVSYYNKDVKDEIYLARGLSGDLNIVGIGVHKKPLGVVWCSTSYSIEKALEVAGFTEFFDYRVMSETLYLVKDNKLWIKGDFPLAQRARQYPATAPYAGYAGKTQRDCTPGTAQETTPSCGPTTNLPVTGVSSMMGKLRPGKHIDTHVEDEVAIATYPNYDYSTAKVLDLPDDVKKNTQVPGSRSEEEETVPAAHISCYGCACTGPAHELHSEDPSAIVYDYALGHAFCETCFGFWRRNNGEDTVLSENAVLGRVLRPRLSIVRKEKDGTKPTGTIGYL